MPFADLPGVRLYYEEAGAGAPLVLLHGIGADHLDWEYQVPTLAQHYRVVTPDLRGFGSSQKAGRYSIATFAADTWALLDALGIERFCLVGHSMGGAVALQMAVDRPQRVERLVAADTLPSFRIDTFGKRLMFAYRYFMMALFGPQRLARAISAKLFPGPHQQALRDRGGGKVNDRMAYLRTLRGLVGWSVADRLDRLTLPVLVAAAEHDYFPVSEAEAFARALPDARLRIFEQMHHAVPLEAPEQFNAALLEFLSGRETRAQEAPQPAATVRA
ncbi:MAG: alpha/beta hydrolase [Nevskia sp.]|nr:alpha/beta hydrolase [Nevskia sp.]